MIQHYFKIAFRNMRKYRNQSIISIVGLATGFLFFMVCNYYVQYHLFFNTSIPNADRMYKISTTLSENDLRNEFPEIEKVMTFPSYGIIGAQKLYSIHIEDKEALYRAFFTNALIPSFIDFFSLQIVHGTKEMITSTNDGIVLFESTANKITNNTISLIGKELMVDSWLSIPIVGILKDPPENSLFGKRKHFYFRVGQTALATSTTNIVNQNYYIQLNKNASQKSFLKKYQNYFDKQKIETIKHPEPITGLTNFSEYNINICKFLFVFGLLILLSTLFNFILFQISLYFNRFKEYGIRIVNGVTGQQFALQLFVDVMIRFLLAGFIVFLILELFFPIFSKTYYDLTYINLNLTLLREHLLKFILYGTILSFGISYILSRNVLRLCSRSLFGFFIQRNNRDVGRNILLFLQLTVIIIFVAATGIVKLQVDSMRYDIFSNLTPNERKSILHFSVNYPQLRGQQALLTQNILKSNHTLDVTYSDAEIIGSYYHIGDNKIVGIDDKIARRYNIAYNFFEFFNGRIIQGNTFDSAMNSGDVFVNKMFMELFPGESLIGKTVEYGSNRTTYRIVGVIDNIQFVLTGIEDGVEEANNIMNKEFIFIRPIPVNQSSLNYYVKCKTGKIKEAKQHIESCIKEFVPIGYEMEFETLQEKIDKTFSKEKLIAFSSGIMFLVSLILGLLSIYSSILMSVEKRRKEIAIRKINGAELKDIILLFGKTYFALWSFACLISFPFIYFYAQQWLEKYKEPISLNFGLFGIIYVIIMLIISLIVIFQINKTAKANPAEVIKLDA